MIATHKTEIHRFIQNALLEDIGDGDHTSLATIPQGLKGKARLLVKDNGIIAGVELALEIFREVDPHLYVDLIIPEGAIVTHNDTVFIVQGSVHAILMAERLVLNCMQRMSAIATSTNAIVKKIRHTGCQVLDTRKTTPGFRLAEKWAVATGGGVNHRFGLYDMILIKDNHIDFAGGIKPALDAVRLYLASTGKNLKVVIEVRSMHELAQVIENGPVERILLDNFKTDQLIEAVKFINRRYNTEASGNITANNALSYAETGVNFISLGAITHSVPNFDLSLKACS